MMLKSVLERLGIIGSVPPAVNGDKPSDNIVLELLKLNHAEVNGLRRLDQQFIYVPLAALAGAVWRIADRPEPLGLAIPWCITALALLLVALLVGFGLRRNQDRHTDLLKRRSCLLKQLRQPPVVLDEAYARGRLIYFLLFAVGWAAGDAALAWLLFAR